MDESVVHHHVEHAVGGDADGQPPQRRQPPSAEHEQRDSDDRKDHGEAVVGLEATSPGLMVAAVPAVADAVHHPSVHGVAHRLHTDEPAEDTERVRHATTAMCSSLARSSARSSSVGRAWRSHRIITMVSTAKAYRYSSARMFQTGYSCEVSSGR